MQLSIVDGGGGSDPYLFHIVLHAEDSGDARAPALCGEDVVIEDPDYYLDQAWHFPLAEENLCAICCARFGRMRRGTEGEEGE